MTAIFGVLTEPERGANRTRVLRAGAPPPFEVQLAEHHGTLLALARRLAATEAQALDLVQDTFVRALEKQSSFRPGTSLGAWMITILHHRFIDLCRRERARGTPRSIDDPGLELPAPEPEPPRAWSRLDESAVREAAERLPPEMREVYRLHAFEGLGYAEIATRLKIPQNTVGTRLLRARKKLRQILEEVAG